MVSSKSATEFFQVLTLKEFTNAEGGSLKNSDGDDIKCDIRIPFNFGATLGVPDKYYLAGYDTVVP